MLRITAASPNAIEKAKSALQHQDTKGVASVTIEIEWEDVDENQEKGKLHRGDEHEFVKLVRDNPGLTCQEYAEKTDVINESSITGVASSVWTKGLVTRDSKIPYRYTGLTEHGKKELKRLE